MSQERDPTDDAGPGDLPERIRQREERMRRLQAELDRVESAKKLGRRERVATSSKLVALSLGALLLLAGGVWGANQLGSLAPGNECRFHEHASFRVFDRGQELDFRHPRFDMRHMAMRAHLHQPNDWQIHLEGGCANIAQFFGLMGMELKPGYLRLDKEIHDSRVLEDNGNDTLRFFLYHDVDGNWTWQEYPDLLSHQLRNDQRMLITYGNLTEEEIASQQSRVPPVPRSNG